MARDVTKCATIFMGTMTHPESLLNYVITERADFIRNKFPAIIEEPTREDLWNEFCRIYKEYVPTDEEMQEYENATSKMESPNEKAAMDFYRAHRHDMDDWVVLWPSRFPYHKLMIEKLSIGSHAFSTEFLNIPYNKEDMLFNSDLFNYHDPFMQFPHDQYNISLGIDWASGKERGDYSAVAVVAQDKKTKRFYIAESYLKRVHPDEFIKDIVQLVLKWDPQVVCSESNMMQEFASDTLKKELLKVGYPSFLRVKKIQNRSRKQTRIEMLHPMVENGELSFNPNHRLLINQFEQFGLGTGAKASTHDDGPDSVEMAVSGLKQSRSSIQPKKGWM
jgi:predicted phage terminase large subunit-like protein